MANKTDRRALEDLIEHIIAKRYRKHMHYAESAGGERLYGVWAGPKEKGRARMIVDPCPHADAESARMSLIVNDLADLVENGGREEL